MEDDNKNKGTKEMAEESSEETVDAVDAVDAVDETSAEETTAPVVETPANLAPAGVAPAVMTPTPAVQQNREQGTVVLSQEAFDAFMADFNKTKQDLNSVLAIQSKNDLNKIEEMRRAGKLVKSVKIRKVNGKYVIGWKTVEDEVFVDSASGRLVERQTVRVFFDDQTHQDYSMRQWATAPEYVPFEVIKESKDSEGYLFFTVKSDDGKEFEINSMYVN